MTNRVNGWEKKSSPGTRPQTIFSSIPGLLVKLRLVLFVAEPATFELGHIELFTAFAWGCGCVDFLEIDGQNAGVNLGGGKAEVAEQFLNVAHAGTAFQHFSRASMAKPMRRRVGRQARSLGVAADDAAQHGGRETTARIVDEETIHGGFAVRSSQQRGANVRHVVAQVSGGGAADGNDAVAFTFRPH